MAEKKVISIGFEIPGHSNDMHEYTSDQSLLDADIIIFEPEIFNDSNGKPEFNEDFSHKLKVSSKHWNSEIKTSLAYGKTIFLLLKKSQVAQIYSGRSEIRGSRTKVNFVEDFHNYDFLPVQIPPIIAKGGTEIVFKGNLEFQNFWKQFKEYLHYESYLDGNIKRPVFVTRTGEKPIGGVIQVGTGHLVILPPLKYDKSKFVKVDEKKDKAFWSKQAMIFGENLIKSLIEIDKSINFSVGKTPPPDWVNNPVYISENENKIKDDISEISNKIEELNEQKEKLVSHLLKEQQLKNLLFETGKPLESAVIIALKILRFEAENYNDGILEIDQIIKSPEGGRFIGECEGKDNGSINIDKFRQLEENIQTDLAREEINNPATGILFGNGFRLILPEKRPAQFTDKCLSSAKRGTILIRTADLYPIVKYIQKSNNKEFAAECRVAINNGIGGIVNFPQIPTIEVNKKP